MVESIRGVLNELGYQDIIETPKDFRVTPLYRESKSRTVLSVRKDSGRWMDFAMGQSGTLEELVKLSLNLSTIDEATKWLGSKNVRIITKTGPKQTLSSPKIFDKEILAKLQKDTSYWEGRGIQRHVLEKFGGGVAYGGKMAGRYVFPIFNSKEQIVGFSGRDIYNNSERSKWKHIGNTGEWVYPAKLSSVSIREKRSAILVESVGDALALFNAGIENVLILFSVNLGPGVLNYLIRMDVNCIIIALNNDGSEQGAGNKASQKIKDRLSNYFDSHQIEIALPDKKDFGEMNMGEILKWHSDRQCK